MKGTGAKPPPVGGTIPGLHTEIWILTHADLKDVPRIKTVTKFLANAFKVAEATFDPSVASRRAGYLTP